MSTRVPRRAVVKPERGHRQHEGLTCGAAILLDGVPCTFQSELVM